MRHNRTHIVLIGLLFFASDGLTQEIRFSQYQAAPAYINPASVGTTLHPVLRVNSRIQRFGVVAFRTGYASLSLPISLSSTKELPIGGVGLNVLQDVAGESSEFRTTIAQLSAAYNIYLNRRGTQWLSLGLQAGYRQVRVDYSQLNWPSQLRYNGFSGTGLPIENAENQLGALSINSGLFWSYDATRNPLSEAPPVRLYAGFSLQNINEPTYNFLSASQSSLNLGYSALGGAEFWINDRWTLAPDGLVLWYEQWFAYQAGTSATYHTQYSTPSNPVPSPLRLTAGTWYRDESSLVFLVGMGGRKWQAALSYDANLATTRRGVSNQYALELSLRYQWFGNNALKSQSTPLY
ncbi:PorP/SprF family type IX secretion system membrane protein [Tunicatimonas pelagia]|uniref:PorP/SprF family type IX secretion system membrane protein n=1 Tax=Tunicatimonas pelagia TaxID=931531 RepID=UPI0026670E31|nr:PorP/SprF family type IX secretion system membrane protein [Tunicatimonas pelagia]WKN42503.1 PorP/SprF family type IX secretion system membrane protein [Tunicatimonas pelagia]